MELSERAKVQTKKVTRLMLKEYGADLKRRRKERGVTRIELSQRTGLSCEDIDSAERGLAGLTEGEKQRIEKFLKWQRII